MVNPRLSLGLVAALVLHASPALAAMGPDFDFSNLSGAFAGAVMVLIGAVVISTAFGRPGQRGAMFGVALAGGFMGVVLGAALGTALDGRATMLLTPILAVLGTVAGGLWARRRHQARGGDDNA